MENHNAENSLPDGGGYRWVHKDELVHEALPSLMRKVVLDGAGGPAPLCEKQVSSAAPSPHGLPAPP